MTVIRNLTIAIFVVVITTQFTQITPVVFGLLVLFLFLLNSKINKGVSSILESEKELRADINTLSKNVSLIHSSYLRHEKTLNELSIKILKLEKTIEKIAKQQRDGR